MGILDNFEAWVNFDDEEPINDGLALKMFKECVCNNCGCSDESDSKDILSPQDPR